MVGAAVGAGVGLSFALVELVAQSWHSRLPPAIASSIVLADVLVLAIAGAVVERLPRVARHRNALLLGAVVALATFSHAAGTALGVAEEVYVAYDVALPRWLCLALAAVAAGAIAAVWTPAAVAALRTRAPVVPFWLWAVATALSAATIFVGAAVDTAGLASIREVGGIATLAAIGLAGLVAIRLCALASQRPGLALAAIAIISVPIGIASGWIAVPPHAPTPPVEASHRPNVFLIVLDTVRADHLSAYGYARPTSPALERLAAESVTYEHAISPATWTIPAHASIMTGLLPSEHGAEIISAPDGTHHVHVIDRNATTLAEALHAEGYATGAFLANGLSLMPVFGLERGFDRFYVPTRASFFVRPSLGSLVAAVYPDEYTAFIRPFRPAARMSEVALEWLDAQRARPTFVVLNFMEAHYPYDVRAPYADRFPGIQPIREDWRDPWSWYRTLADAVDRGAPVDPAARRHLEASYDAAIAFLDSELGRLFDALRARKLWDDALVIVTADHGELFGEHGLLQHKVEPYEGVVHVPLIVKYPRARRVERVRDVVSTRDVYPLVLAEVAGRPAPPASPVVVEFYPSPKRNVVRPQRARFAGYEGDEKVVWSSDGHNEAYRLSTDPTEAENLYDADSAATYAARLTALEQRFAHSTIAGLKANVARDGLVQRFRSLGYLE